MKIINLIAKNIKNLKAVEIHPEDNTVMLKGANGAGKSAVLDSILVALTGKRIDQIIRNGEEKAEIILDLGEYVIRKRITEKGATLDVTTKAGLTAPSPQGLLDNIIGKISFDPLAFSRMKPKEQSDLLKVLAGLNFSEIDEKSKAAYEERTATNRLLKESETLLNTMTKPEAGLPSEPVSFDEQFKKVKDLNARRDDFKNSLDIKICTEKDITVLKETIRQAEDQLSVLRDTLAKSESLLSNFVLPEEVSEEQILAAEKELNKVSETNKKISASADYIRAKSNLDKYQKSSEDLTNEINEYQKQKEQMIAAAKFPLDGLAVDGDVVMFNGIPLERLSTGQQIRVSTAIAMALNPQLKVIMIREGSLLDDAGIEEITALAKERDYQLWIEKVEDGQPVGIHIEDGNIVEQTVTA